MRRPVRVALMVAALSLLIAASVTAGNLGNWQATTLRIADGVTLEDAVFRGEHAVVLWREDGPKVTIGLSTDGGSTFERRWATVPNARQAEADVCGTNLYVTYARPGDNGWEIELNARGLFGSVGSGPIDVFEGGGTALHPDVACSGPRVFVSWLVRSVGEVHVFVDHALWPELTFGKTEPQSLGQTQPAFGPPAAAGVADRAYVVRQVSADFVTGPVIIHRWAVGGGATAPVTDLGDRQLAPAGEFPGIDAVGDTVAVAWADHSTGVANLWTRVSDDRGETWGPRRRVVQAGTDTVLIVQSVAIDGQRIVVSYVQASLFGGGDQRMLSTTTDFANVNDRRLSGIEDDLVLGWMTVPGVDHQVLVGAVDTGRRIRFVRR